MCRSRYANGPPSPLGADTLPHVADTGWSEGGVTDQPPLLDGFDRSPATPRSSTRCTARARPTLQELGAVVASAEAREHARLADVHPPVLHTHDRHGPRRDDVEFHSSWH